jgi:hypothetical protein
MALPTSLSTSTFPVANSFVGPFKGANGNFYIFMRSSTSASTLQVHEATDPTNSFTKLSESLRFANNIQSIWIYQDASDADIFHIAVVVVSTARVSYSKIDVGGATGVISTDATDDKHYRHDGFSATINSSYAGASIITPEGISWDGSNVINADSSTDKHYRRSGFSVTVSSSYSSPSSVPTGITWDGSNVLSADSNVDKHYRHSGFSATISNSYSAPSTAPRGMAWDGSNVLSADSDADKHYLHSGFSTTISNSYSAPSTTPTGISWDGSNVVSADNNVDKHYLHSGFSATISNSYSAPSTEPRGIAWASFFFTVANQTIETPATAPGTSDISISIAVRSDGDVIVLYNGDPDKVHGTDYDRVDYARREGSTWTVGVDVTGGTGNQVNYTGSAVVKGSGDNMHFFWKDDTADVRWGRTLDPSTNGLSTRRSQSSSNVFSHIHGRGVSFDDAGTQRVVVPTASASVGHAWRHTEDGSGDLADNGTLTQFADSGTVGINGGFTLNVTSALEGASQMHIIWEQSASDDLFHDEAATPQSSWGTDTDLLGAVTINQVQGANVYTRAGATVLGYVYEISGVQTYNELELVAAAGGTNRRALIGVGR